MEDARSGLKNHRLIRSRLHDGTGSQGLAIQQRTDDSAIRCHHRRTVGRKNFSCTLTPPPLARGPIGQTLAETHQILRRRRSGGDCRRIHRIGNRGWIGRRSSCRGGGSFLFLCRRILEHRIRLYRHDQRNRNQEASHCQAERRKSKMKCMPRQIH